MTYLRDAIADRLPDNYEARLEEQINLVEASGGRLTQRQPDLGVSRLGPRTGPPIAAEGAVATLEPVIMHHPAYERIWEARIQVIHRPGRGLVTLLELLSPTKKRGDGFHQYRAKRNEIFCEKQVHLVELELLVGGQRLPMHEPLPHGDFYVLVSRANQRPDAEVYAWTVRQPLPAIPIPLKQPDPDIWIPLGEVFHTAYERGHYARSIEYSAPLTVPLPADELAWAEEVARSRSQAS